MATQKPEIAQCLGGHVEPNKAIYPRSQSGPTPDDSPEIAEAEQRGREDNADHSMCYVHGSEALRALLVRAFSEGVIAQREATRASGGSVGQIVAANPYEQRTLPEGRVDD